MRTEERTNERTNERRRAPQGSWMDGWTEPKVAVAMSGSIASSSSWLRRRRRRRPSGSLPQSVRSGPMRVRSRGGEERRRHAAAGAEGEDVREVIPGCRRRDLVSLHPFGDVDSGRTRHRLQLFPRTCSARRQVHVPRTYVPIQIKNIQCISDIRPELGPRKIALITNMALYQMLLWRGPGEGVEGLI